jgi:hypothetical protein
MTVTQEPASDGKIAVRLRDVTSNRPMPASAGSAS